MSHSPSTAPLVPRVAIIGLTGSGKTVLAVALAKYLGGDNPQGILLAPDDPRTLKFVENNWNRLQTGEWPPSTAQGEINELRWTLRTGTTAQCPLRLVDLAGQDLRRLFEDEEIDHLESLEPQLQAVARYCLGASIVIVVVNLRDFMNEADDSRRVGNQAALKAALDRLSTGERRVCIAITQADLFDQAAREANGWQRLLKEQAYWIYDFVQHRSVKLIVVSAVQDTEVEAITNEKPRRVPRRGFRSHGLDRLASWLAEQVNDVIGDEQRRTSAEAIRVAEHLEAHAANLEKAAAPSEPELPWSSLAVVVALLILVFFSVKGCDKGSTEKDVAPRGTFVSGTSAGTGLFDHGVEATMIIRNDGAGGHISVTAIVYQQDVEIERQTQTEYLNAGESRTFEYQLNQIEDLALGHEVKYDISPR